MAGFKHHLTPAAAWAIVALGGGLAAPSFVLAQGGEAASGPPATAPAPETAASPTAGELTVVAPRVVRGEVGPAWAQGTPVEVVTQAKTVSFADLDLTTENGANEFRKRIMYAALDACDELEAQYPSTHYILAPATQNCPDETATAALKVGEQVIAASRTHHAG